MISRGIAGARIGRWRHTAILVLITHLATRFCHADSIAVHGIPSVLAPGVEGSMLIATRFASTETQAAAVALDGATGPVVLVRQVSGQHCPPYDPAEVRGAFVLENSTDINACSIGRRVEAAAAAGAIGWLYVAAAEAGNRPLVTFSVQSDDGEGAFEARARSTFISTRAPTLLRTSEPPGNNGAFGRTSLPAISEPGERCCKWQIPVATTVLVLDILGGNW
ncbi:hypothetical protein T492DRAFT_875641 [Pavlovales sp. CCMP2436]|nr:hypothetical protein T492DRAFT_875641 [Pavlovales sp. CCMP2436]